MIRSQQNSGLRLRTGYRREVSFEYEATDLLAFVDETGHDSLSDPNHRLFGLGGCAVPLPVYYERLVKPWLELRNAHFGDIEGALHASELTPDGAGIEALAEFFRGYPFYRVAALVTPASVNDEGEEPYDLCASTLISFLHQIGVINSCRRIVLTFESAGAADAVATRSLSQQARFTDSAHDYLPISVFRARKRDRVPGLEVADFVMHAAGTQVRKGLGQRPQRKDFQAVFSGVSDDWVRFGLLDQAADDPPERLPVV
jgi:hypothetical protein